MKGLVIYDSSYGNTRMVAEAIADGLIASGVPVDVQYVKDVKKLRAADYDFLVIGSPTKCGTMSFAIKGFLGKLKEKEWRNKSFAAFDTENPENIEQSRLLNKQWSAAEKIAEKLESKQLHRLLPVLKSVVIGWKGPLQDGEIPRAKGYAGELAAKLQEDKEHYTLPSETTGCTCK